MRARIITFGLSVFLLWSSLLTLHHHERFSNAQEIKAATEANFVALAPDENWLGEKINYCTYAFTEASIHTRYYVLNCRVDSFVSFTHRSDKYYLLFRVLRN
jgi:hypothetical protein